MSDVLAEVLAEVRVLSQQLAELRREYDQHIHVTRSGPYMATGKPHVSPAMTSVEELR